MYKCPNSVSLVANQTSRRSWLFSSCSFTSSECVRCFSSDRRNLYDVLGLKSDATTKEIKQAFYEKSKQHHPDVQANDKNDTSDEFVKVNEAYQVLSDSKTRENYDMQLSDKRYKDGNMSSGHGMYNFDSKAYTEFYQRRRKAMENQNFRGRPTPSHKYEQFKGFRYQTEREKRWERYEYMLKRRAELMREERKWMTFVTFLALCTFIAILRH